MTFTNFEQPLTVGLQRCATYILFGSIQLLLLPTTTDYVNPGLKPPEEALIKSVSATEIYFETNNISKIKNIVFANWFL